MWKKQLLMRKALDKEVPIYKNMLCQLKEKEKWASSNRENSKNASGKKFKSAHSSRSTNEFDED